MVGPTGRSKLSTYELVESKPPVEEHGYPDTPTPYQVSRLILTKTFPLPFREVHIRLSRRRRKFQWNTMIDTIRGPQVMNEILAWQGNSGSGQLDLDSNPWIHHGRWERRQSNVE